MSYTIEDAAWDDAYEHMSRELYPEHKALAIIDFTYERLRSYYISKPDVLVPAVRNFKQAKQLLANGHLAASLVFAASATELFLKGSLLRPVVFGLVHSESLAELVVASTLSQTGFKRYEKLLSGLFQEVARMDIKKLTRPGSIKPLLEEASQTQELRNKVVHSGADVTQAEAEFSVAIATEVFNQILGPVLRELGLSVMKEGHLHNEET